MAVTTWRKVTVKMQSAIGAATAISAITKANPAVATSTGHGLADGDMVVIRSASMHQLNYKVVRVDNKADNTFELEGVDSTLFDDFASATFEKLTMATTISTMTTISASGGDFPFLSTSTIHSAINTQIPDIANPITYSAENLWDPSDAGQAAMKAANLLQGERAFLFQFANGYKMYFFGYVGFAGVPGGSAGAVATSQSVFTINGDPTYYVS